MGNKKIAVGDEIRGHSELLALPQALSELLHEMDKPDFSADNLATIILKDPSLTGRILKLANSAFYNRFHEISTVHGAVQMLGVTTVKCLALSSSILHPEKIQEESGVDPKDYFSQILTVAAAAEKIAPRVGLNSAEEAFIAGLLHDIGTMFFLHHHPHEYREVLFQVKNGHDILALEENMFGMNHAEVGYHLAVKWRVPEQISDAIRNHHTEPDKNDDKLINVIRLASTMTQETVVANGLEVGTWIGKINKVAQALDMSKEEIDEISVSLLSWTRSIADYLGVDIGSTEEILTRANHEIWNTYLMVENLFKERQELSKKLLEEERAKGAIEAKNIALSTLSHYLNNAAMAIYGRSQLLRIDIEKGEEEKIMRNLPISLDVIDKSIKKIVAVLCEIKEISPMDEGTYLNASHALDLDNRVAERMKMMDIDGEVVTRPMEPAVK